MLKYDHKLNQLRIMLAIENGEHGDENKDFGAHLNHWHGAAKPIQLDATALECLIKHYEAREAAEGEA